jgi:arginase
VTQDKTIGFVGVPMDLGGGRRGVDMGPSAIRIADLEREVRSLGFGFEDHGNVPVREPDSRVAEDPNAKFLDEIAECCGSLRSKVEALVDAGRLPLVVGGDHSIACGTVAGIASHYHKRNERIGLLWFDAHGDMNTPETSDSGNIHGMPLACCLGHGPDALTRLADRFPMVDVKNAVLVGVRSLDKGEVALIRDLGVKCFTMRDIDLRGIHSVMEEALATVNNDTAGFHCSFDLDGTDPGVSPGVGTPVPGGTTYRESHAVMEMVAATKRMVGLEMTEINPILDTSNQTARVAVEFVMSALGKLTL